MIQIVVVDASKRECYADEIDAYFRLRADVFVKELKWSAMTVVDGRERDQFDHEDAIHVLALDDGQVVGGVRLLPTTRPVLINTVFPQAIAMPLEIGPRFYEWSRIFVVRSHRGEGALSPTTGAIICGLFEYLLAIDCASLHAVGETWWMPRFIGLGLEPRPLGMPFDHEHYSLVGFTIVPSAEKVVRMKEIYGFGDHRFYRPSLDRAATNPSLSLISEDIR